jgi:hypothetical protein
MARVDTGGRGSGSVVVVDELLHAEQLKSRRQRAARVLDMVTILPASVMPGELGGREMLAPSWLSASSFVFCGIDRVSRKAISASQPAAVY